ncbi:capsule biosynthesis protein [Ralstonia solanacearum]|uniref:capsule biosynthesis protein n=1 Tax=Ralstonia solanacearum TaxID=305 RepID=UPI0001D97EC7|nr:capsular biosynthesis protein [Ralstonia solanacearum]CBJ51882.1 putative Capsule polysaccharide export protein kpsS [Ralstonia solanacearum PSI07]
MIEGGPASLKAQRVLLLQGPMGPFFRRLARDLEAVGAQVLKVNFNGGDWLFYPTGAIHYRGTMPNWPAFFERLLRDHRIDLVLLFGDCRPVHEEIQRICQRCGVKTGVFEEGYVRPDYITLEHCGVNGYSQTPRSPAVYRQAPEENTPPPHPVGNTFWHAVRWAILYYVAAALLSPVFARYRHHRPLTLLEAGPWLRSVWRKLHYRIRERGVQSELAGPLSGRYFLLALQVHNDAQVRVHSAHETVAQFIDETLQSFARRAPADAILVIKHHPLDRGYHDYRRLIRQRAEALDLRQRVRYLHDQHLPTLLTHARGIVLINSTVGLSALDHGKPVKACGTAVYNLPGLTYQGPLDTFWTAAPAFVPDPALFLRFRTYLIRHTQLNGNFYKRLDSAGNRVGLIWSEATGDAVLTGFGLPGGFVSRPE